MKTELNEYEQQAKSFLDSTNTKFKAEFLYNGKHFDNDKELRDVYKITLKRGSREYFFNFGQSLNDSGFYYTMGVQKVQIDRKFLNPKMKTHLLGHVRRESGGAFLNNKKSDVIHYPKAPTAYSVLACLTKYDPGTFEDFCSEFGYDEDSRSAEKTFKAVKDEYMNVCALYNDEELELMAEIQ